MPRCWRSHWCYRQPFLAFICFLLWARMDRAAGSAAFSDCGLVEALVIGSVLYSMPFVVQPIRNAFEAFGDRPLEVAATLRASFLAGGAATLDSATLTGVGPVATQDQIFVLGREGVCKPLAGRTNVSVLRCHVAEVLLAEAPCRL